MLRSGCRRVWEAFLAFRHTPPVNINALSYIMKIKNSPGQILTYMHMIYISRYIHMYYTDWQSIKGPNWTFQNNKFIPLPPEATILLFHDALGNQKYFFQSMWFAHTITWHFERLALIHEIDPTWHVKSRMVKFQPKSLLFMNIAADNLMLRALNDLR